MSATASTAPSRPKATAAVNAAMIDPDTKSRSLTSTEENSNATKATANVAHNHSGPGVSWTTKSAASVAVPSTAKVPARMVALRSSGFIKVWVAGLPGVLFDQPTLAHLAGRSH